MSSFLVIQTASIGDVILTTPIMESLHAGFPGAGIDLLVKKGNEGLFAGHPYLRRIMVWEKSSGKYLKLFKLMGMIRNTGYDHVINVQRFASTGMLTALSGAPDKTGFTKNPFSVFFTQRIKHIISVDGHAFHEVDRNLSLLKHLGIPIVRKPALYPQQADREAVSAYMDRDYLCIAPASLWFTKQYPAEKWIEFLDALPDRYTVYLLGSSQDHSLCQLIINQTRHKNAVNLAGKFSLLQTAALMKGAIMNFVNDSAPQHLASAVNAAVSAIFCSTVPSFGFGPLSENAAVIETHKKLDCRPCGLHGRNTCPREHFDCARSIHTNQLLERVKL